MALWVLTKSERYSKEWEIFRTELCTEHKQKYLNGTLSFYRETEIALKMLRHK